MYSAPKSVDTKRSWPLWLLLAAHWLVAALPWLAIAGMAAWAWRASQSIGRWPVPLEDDPKYIAVGDGIYDWLGELSDALISLAFVSIVILPVLAAMTWSRYRRVSGYGLVAFYVLGVVVFIIDPFGLFAWVAD